MPNGMSIPFDLAEGGLLLAFIRGLSVTALFSAFGTLLFGALVAPRAFVRMEPDNAARIERVLKRLVWASLAVETAALIAWLVVESGLLADATDLEGSFAAVGPVLSETAFGHLVALQLAVIPVIAAALAGGGRFRWPAAAGLAALATLLQAGHSHALAMEQGPSLLLVSDGLHLLSAGAWLGGLVPLLLLVRMAPPKAGATAARYFSPLGKLCIYGLLASAVYQAWALLGGIPGLVGTAYGRMVLVKLALFVVLFGFAWLNRYRLAPALLRDNGAEAKRALILSIALQTGFGLAVVIAAGILSSLPPGLHTQPVWPFGEQLSLVTVQEDPASRSEIIDAALMLCAALVSLALGITFKRLRWPALALAAIVAWLASQHLDLLFVEAHPTSFYRSPTGFAATAIAAGAALFPEHCATCHGAEGRGDGPNANDLPVRPADLTAGHLWGHSDGELFWWLSHGIEAPGGGISMPGFAAALSDDQRWDLIDYVRSHNAGLVHAALHNWLHPLRAPDFAMSCGSGRHMALADLRGKIVRIVFANAAVEAPKAEMEIVTILVPPEGASTTPADETCVASDPAIRTAYGVIAGLSPDHLPDTQFLVDANGWLRATGRVGLEAGFADPDGMIGTIEEICRHPVDPDADTDVHHHHP
ncbi:MAG TPA: CopD family protein [Aliidongia sp.]|nr:CopD family protein [Aliidongia sp.]